jgi:predicted O-methyltransferase YrrM
MLAIPTYASPDTSLTFALARGREALSQAGIQSALLILEGNCHVDDSRNSIVRDFLESDCTDLMFLDADVTFEPGDLVQLCGRECDIVGGVYPFRREGGETLPCRLSENREVVDGLREVEGLPTGFMKIRRAVFEKMAPTRPVYIDKYCPTILFFDRPTPDENGLRWGGDLDFCNRWRAMGGKLYADEELRIGHVAKIVVRDSLAANIRRATGTTLKYLIPLIRGGSEKEGHFDELVRFADNRYTADAMGLALVTMLARKCTGPIIETGSGLSSILMAAASGQRVYSLEHLEHYAGQTRGWAQEAGTGNLSVCFAPLTDDLWYDAGQFDLPDKFSLGFCDGPPRLCGTRMRFFEEFGERCTIIAVDDIKTDHNYARAVRKWADDNGREFTLLGRAALLGRADPSRARKAKVT